MWQGLPKHTTYAHNGKEPFSSPIDSTINKLTNYHNTTAKRWQVYFSWGLFLKPFRCLRVLKCSLNAIGWLVQADTLLKITTWLIHGVGYGVNYNYFMTFWVQWDLTLDHFTQKLLSFAVTHHFMSTHQPPPSTPIKLLVVFTKNNLKWWVNQPGVHCGVHRL